MHVELESFTLQALYVEAGNCPAAVQIKNETPIIDLLCAADLKCCVVAVNSSRTLL